jgi:hypothetical protein
MKLKTFFALAFILSIYTSAFAVPDNLYSLRGASKHQIQEQYGQPRDIIGPVGDPPITRWVYSDFAVVFEYDLVLHAYSRKPEVENLPASAIPKRPDPSVGDTLNLPD